MSISNSHSKALILPGGGARAAYQVGVIKAISDILPEQEATPFRVYSGISAGAINATVLAANSVNFKQGVSVLEDVWKNFKVNQVYKTDNGLSLKNAMRWMLTVISAGRMQKQPMSILDNQPLRELLTEKINLSGIQEGIDQNVLDGLVVICSAYYSALSVHLVKRQISVLNISWLRLLFLTYFPQFM